MIFNPVRISQGEDQVGELMLLEFGDKVLVLLVGELAGVVFKDSLGSLATGRVEEHNRGNIISIWFGDAGYLLGQDVGGVGALASSICISSNDFILGFAGGTGFG